MKHFDDSQMTVGSGNLFSDLGFPPAEARLLELRSRLIIALRKHLERERIPAPPRISDLMRGLGRGGWPRCFRLLSDLQAALRRFAVHFFLFEGFEDFHPLRDAAEGGVFAV